MADPGVDSQGMHATEVRSLELLLVLFQVESLVYFGLMGVARAFHQTGVAEFDQAFQYNPDYQRTKCKFYFK